MQPANTFHLGSVFDPLPGESVLNKYECKEGCSRCCGPESSVAFTTDRVIARHQAARRCIDYWCCCFCRPPLIDTAINLRDIEVLSQYQGSCKCNEEFFACKIPCWLSLIIGFCCECSCCGDVPKYINVKGGFGTEILTIERSEAVTALNRLAALIQPFRERQTRSQF